MPCEPKSTRSTRKDVIRAVWESCGRTGKLSSWIDHFSTWDVYPVTVGGIVVGGVLALGPEVHVGVLQQYHREWLRPALWRAVFRDRSARFGFLVTQVAAGRPDDFVRRCGFEPAFRKGESQFYLRPHNA